MLSRRRKRLQCTATGHAVDYVRVQQHMRIPSLNRELLEQLAHAAGQLGCAKLKAGNESLLKLLSNPFMRLRNNLVLLRDALPSWQLRQQLREAIVKAIVLEWEAWAAWLFKVRDMGQAASNAVGLSVSVKVKLNASGGHRCT